MKVTLAYAERQMRHWIRKVEGLTRLTSNASNAEKEAKEKEASPQTPYKKQESQEKDSELNARDKDLFQEFWEAYPRRRRYDRKKCARKYSALLEESGDAEGMHAKVMEGLGAWKASREWTHDGGEYVCMPMTWLNQRRWEAPPPEADKETAGERGGRGWVRRGSVPTSYLQSTPEQLARYQRKRDEAQGRKS